MKRICSFLFIILISLGCSENSFVGQKGKQDNSFNADSLERDFDINTIKDFAIKEKLERITQPLDILFMVQGGSTMIAKGYDLIDTFETFMDNLDPKIDWRIAVTPDDPTTGCVQVIKNTGVGGVEAKLYIEKSDYEKDRSKTVSRLVDTIVNPGARQLYIREGLFGALKAFNLFKNEQYYQYMSDKQRKNCDKWYRDKSRVVVIFISDVDHCSYSTLPSTCEITDRTVPLGSVTSTCADTNCANVEVKEITEDKCNEVRKFNPGLADKCVKEEYKNVKYYKIEGLKCKKDSSGNCIKSTASTTYYSKNPDGTRGAVQAIILHYVYQTDLNHSIYNYSTPADSEPEHEGKTCKLVRSVKTDSSGNPIKFADGTYDCTTSWVLSNSEKIFERNCAIEYLPGHKYRPEDYNTQLEFDRALDKKHDSLSRTRYKCRAYEDGTCFLSKSLRDPNTNASFTTLDTDEGCNYMYKPQPNKNTIENFGSLKSYFIGMHSPNSSKDIFLSKMQKFRDITDMRFYGFLNLTGNSYNEETKKLLFDDDPDQYGYNIVKNANGTYTVKDLKSKTYKAVIDATGGLIKDLNIINNISDNQESLDTIKSFFKEISSNISLFTNTKYKLRIPMQAIDRLFLAKGCSDKGGIETCKDLLAIKRSSISSNGTGVDLSNLDDKVLKEYTHFVYTLKE